MASRDCSHRAYALSVPHSNGNGTLFCRRRFVTQDGMAVAENPTKNTSKIMTRDRITHGNEAVIESSHNQARAKDFDGDHDGASRACHAAGETTQQGKATKIGRGNIGTRAKDTGRDPRGASMTS